MMALLHILSGIVVGFIGFLPIGMINLNVADTAIKQGVKEALAMSLGASLIGFLQALVSIFFAGVIMARPEIETYLNYISVPVLIGAGLYFLFGPRPKDPSEQTPKLRNQRFIKGALLSTMNVVAIPFWVFYTTYLSSMHLIDLESQLLTVLFALGGGGGMFIVFVIYARLGRYAEQKLAKLTQHSAKAIAAVMFLLALIQVIRIVA